MLHITSIRFTNYKSFKNYTVSLNEFNILVGPNNAGKSTILGSLKILAEGIRKARFKRPETVKGPNNTDIYAYNIDLSQVPVATDNVFYNYDDSTPAIIRFRLSDGNFLQIFFRREGVCFMNYENDSIFVRSPKEFKSYVNIIIGYVPILGPVEYEERLYQKEAARLALLTHRASRNFRNIWFHYPDDFINFKDLVQRTWPGMDIEKPEVNTSTDKTSLNMFCPEERIPREIYWTGFGFQIWCQMLTYIIKNTDASIFLIDEPDIYLHSDLQRQLLGILKLLGPDIIIATHSTELISEAELNDIVIVSRTGRSAKRIKDPTQLQNIFSVLGSNLNPILTQIAKTKRVLFVEGKDFFLLSKFARKVNNDTVANRQNFAVVPVGGFNPTKLKAFREGIEMTIGSKIKSAVVFDRDYRSIPEINQLKKELSKFNEFVHIHSCKEIENFVIIPKSIQKTLDKKVAEYNRKTESNIKVTENIEEILDSLTIRLKSNTQAQLQSHQLKYERRTNKHEKDDDSAIIKCIIEDMDSIWGNMQDRLKTVPGKELLSKLNEYIQNKYKVSLSISSIIESIGKDELPSEVINIIDKIDDFSSRNTEFD